MPEGAVPKRSEVNQLLLAVDAIARSPHVHEYVVGYTGQSADARGRQYRGVGFSHLVILADRLTCDEALALEAAVDEMLRTKTDKRSILYRKWNTWKKGDVHRRSAGGGSKSPMDPVHSVYMAWCAPALE
jgi:hypothetical protein